MTMGKFSVKEKSNEITKLPTIGYIFLTFIGAITLIFAVKENNIYLAFMAGAWLILPITKYIFGIEWWSKE